MAKNKMIHVSFDVVEKFVPRIPIKDARLPGEDDETPRICVAPSILCCLKGMPSADTIIDNLLKAKLPVIIHAYYLSSDSIMSNAEILRKVPDAYLTHESWILKEPDKVRRIDYQLTDPCEVQRTLAWCEHLKYGTCGLKRIPYTDNFDVLYKAAGIDPNTDGAKRIRQKYQFARIAKDMLPQILSLKRSRD